MTRPLTTDAKAEVVAQADITPGDLESLRDALVGLVRTARARLPEARRGWENKADHRERHYGTGCADGMTDALDIVAAYLQKAGVEV